jgi:hypothetical protein
VGSVGPWVHGVGWLTRLVGWVHNFHVWVHIFHSVQVPEYLCFILDHYDPQKKKKNCVVDHRSRVSSSPVSLAST